MSEQPKWKLIANLGDADPLDHDGYFIFQDETGVYPEEAEWLKLNREDDEDTDYIVYRFTLERCTLTEDGVLSDNPFHPDHPVWFARKDPEHKARHGYDRYSELCFMAEGLDMTPLELCLMFCSEDPIQRAIAYREVGEQHGFINLDAYPITITQSEARQRYGLK